MITPDRIEAWRRAAVPGGRVSALTVCNALLDACNEIEGLQVDEKRMREQMSTCLTDRGEFRDDRDRARDAAVALEQEIARLREVHFRECILRALSLSCETCELLGGEAL